MQRPEWAKGDEWDGWIKCHVSNEMSREEADSSGKHIWFTVSSDSQLYLVGASFITIRFPNPEAARVAAMAIIEGMK